MARFIFRFLLAYSDVLFASRESGMPFGLGPVGLTAILYLSNKTPALLHNLRDAPQILNSFIHCDGSMFAMWKKRKLLTSFPLNFASFSLLHL